MIRYAPDPAFLTNAELKTILSDTASVSPRAYSRLEAIGKVN